MRRLLVLTTLMTVLALTGSAFACSAEHSASADQLPAVTAAAPQSAPQSAPATETTTKPKTTESNAGG